MGRNNPPSRLRSNALLPSPFLDLTTSPNSQEEDPGTDWLTVVYVDGVGVW